MKAIPWIGLLVCLLLAGCGSTPGTVSAVPTSTVSPTPDVEAESYAVYETVIREMFLNDVSRIVIRTPTVGDRFTPDQSNGLPVDAATLADYQGRNLQSLLLDADRMNVGVPIILLSQAEQEQFFAEGAGGWDAFYAQYPRAQGILEVSAVGFNPQRTEALLYVGNQSHWLAGAGYVVILVKENGIWKIKEQQMIWIS